MNAEERLTAEREALSQHGHARAPIAVRVVASILSRADGYRATALRVGPGHAYTFSGVSVAAQITRGVAPEHHARLEALLAVLAVAVEDEDARFARRFGARELAQLHHRYRHLSTEQVRWARAELARPPAEQLELFSD
jgi:hypothetical protein